MYQLKHMSCTLQNGYTPLHIAAKKNQMDIATTLLEFSAQPDAESKVCNETHFNANREYVKIILYQKNGLLT